MNTRWVVRVGVGMALLGATVVIPAGPAAAPPPYYSCDPGEVCVWQHTNFKGCYTDMPVPGWDSDWIDENGPFWQNCAGHINDQVSSYWNRGDRVVIFYTKPGGLGNSLCVFPGAKGKRIPWSGMNDKFSSHNNELPEEESPGTPPGAPYPGDAAGPDDCTDRHVPQPGEG